MIRQLHPHTKPQRAESPESVPEVIRECGFDPRDVPANGVAWGVAGLFGMLGIGMGAAALMLSLSAPDRLPLAPAVAAREFQSPAPPLEANFGETRAAIEPAARARLQDSSGRLSIEQAMRVVAGRGWSDPQPPPSRASTAMQRTEALE